MKADLVHNLAEFSFHIIQGLLSRTLYSFLHYHQNWNSKFSGVSALMTYIIGNKWEICFCYFVKYSARKNFI